MTRMLTFIAFLFTTPVHAQFLVRTGRVCSSDEIVNPKN